MRAKLKDNYWFNVIKISLQNACNSPIGNLNIKNLISFFLVGFFGVPLWRTATLGEQYITLKEDFRFAFDGSIIIMLYLLLRFLWDLSYFLYLRPKRLRLCNYLRGALNTCENFKAIDKSFTIYQEVLHKMIQSTIVPKSYIQEFEYEGLLPVPPGWIPDHPNTARYKVIVRLYNDLLECLRYKG